MSASNYYVLAVAIAVGFFFVVWGILHDSGDEMPWITAGISSSILLGGSVIVREIILRSSRKATVVGQAFEREKQNQLPRNASDRSSARKLTIEANAVILNEIRQKSGAAKLLNNISSSHREVFEMCREYLSLNEAELKGIRPNSPRLAPLLKGRTFAAECHHFHLLRWAEIETRSLTAEAQGGGTAIERVESAEKALHVLDTAIGFYPEDAALAQSRSVVQELIASIEVSGLIEMAERSVYLADHEYALRCYGEALRLLEGDLLKGESLDDVKVRVLQEIEHLKFLQKKGCELSDIS